MKGNSESGIFRPYRAQIPLCVRSTGVLVHLMYVQGLTRRRIIEYISALRFHTQYYSVSKGKQCFTVVSYRNIYFHVSWKMCFFFLLVCYYYVRFKQCS